MADSDLMKKYKAWKAKRTAAKTSTNSTATASNPNIDQANKLLDEELARLESLVGTGNNPYTGVSDSIMTDAQKKARDEFTANYNRLQVLREIKKKGGFKPQDAAAASTQTPATPVATTYTPQVQQPVNLAALKDTRQGFYNMGTSPADDTDHNKLLNMRQNEVAKFAALQATVNAGTRDPNVLAAYANQKARLQALDDSINAIGKGATVGYDEVTQQMARMADLPLHTKIINEANTIYGGTQNLPGAQQHGWNGLYQANKTVQDSQDYYAKYLAGRI